MVLVFIHMESVPQSETKNERANGNVTMLKQESIAE